jgi:PHD/YefM family antitoxin component YafN of YafNO toxin-antitoxin module
MPDAVQHGEQAEERVVLARDGHPAAAIVPLHDLRALEERDEAGDAYLSRLAAEAVAQWEPEVRPVGMPIEDIARDLGIDLTAAP